jgi:hypothetical protein
MGAVPLLNKKVDVFVGAPVEFIDVKRGYTVEKSLH